jgi:hypothetical protein
MRQGQQHRRGRGRNNNTSNNHPGNRNKGQNPLTRSFESSGPDVKVRGTPAHIAEKYMQLARDAQSSGDHVLAENYLQHAEHYNRIILAYREQQMQQSGEMMNGNGRHPGAHQLARADFQDGDDAGPDGNGLADDNGQSEQPPFVRHIGEHLRDMQPSFDDPRPQTARHDQPRFRDRQPRGDRQDRQDRQGRDDGFERGEQQAGERFDRHRERPYRQSDQPGEGREMRPHREPREHREPRVPSGDTQREVNGSSAPVEAAGGEEMPAPAQATRGEGAAPSRRRERYGLSADQPEFLRRPVRRPRREQPEQDFAAETPRPVPSADEPAGE